MKKIFIAVSAGLMLFSCKKIEETVTELAAETKQKAEQKARDAVQETVNEQFNKVMNAENVEFDSIFPKQNAAVVTETTGRRIKLPTGTDVYLFKYNTANKDELLQNLVLQPTTSEEKSSKEIKKVDGKAIVEKISFAVKFLPANVVPESFLEDLRSDQTIEYYKINRFPNTSTIIYSPKKNTVYQWVEVKK